MLDLRVATWRIPHVSARDLEQVTIPDEDVDARLKAMRVMLDSSGIFYLSTCQRVVVVAATDIAPDVVAARASESFSDPVRPEVFSGYEAFAHLAEVAASLDSLVPGEPEVLGQMKDAFNRSVAHGLVGPDLNRILPAVLRTAKRVRHRTDLGRGKVSLIPLTLDLVDRQLTEAPTSHVAVFGTGVIGRRMLEFLRPYGETSVHVVSRTEERAAEVAGPAGVEAHAIDSFLAAPRPLSLVVLASRARDPYFTADVARSFIPPRGSLLVLDLAMPRNASDEVRAIPGVTLVQLDDLSGISERSRASREQALVRAREVLDEEVDRVREHEAKRAITNDIVDLREAVLQAAEARFDEVVKDLGERGVSPQDPDFRRWYDRTIATVLHVALARLKEDRVAEARRVPVDEADAEGDAYDGAETSDEAAADVKGGVGSKPAPEAQP